MKNNFQLKLISIALLFFITRYALAAVDCNLRPLKSGADYSGCNLSGIEIESGTNLSNINFESATLTNAILIGVNLKNAKFIGAKLESAALSNSDLTNANFSGANLYNAQFQGITGIDSLNFYDALNVKGIDLSGNVIRNTSLLQLIGTSKDYTGAKFNQTVFFDIYLGGANLTNASFIHATLASLFLKDAILRNANFNFAQIGYTVSDDPSNFTGADVSGSQFINTVIASFVQGFELDETTHRFKNLTTDNNTKFFYATLPTGEVCTILSRGFCAQ